MKAKILVIVLFLVTFFNVLSYSRVFYPSKVTFSGDIRTEALISCNPIEDIKTNPNITNVFKDITFERDSTVAIITVKDTCVTVLENSYAFRFVINNIIEWNYPLVSKRYGSVGRIVILRIVNKNGYAITIGFGGTKRAMYYKDADAAMYDEPTIQYKSYVTGIVDCDKFNWGIAEYIFRNYNVKVFDENENEVSDYRPMYR